MSAAIDVNVLVYASDEDDPAYAPARELVDRLVAGPELLYLFWPVLLGYLRIATHPGIRPDPLTPAEARTNLERLLTQPHVRTPGEGEGFWSLYRDTAGEYARGNQVPDAHIATLMRQHGVRVIYTRDRDFRRFDGIEARDPVG